MSNYSLDLKIIAHHMHVELKNLIKNTLDREIINLELKLIRFF